MTETGQQCLSLVVVMVTLCLSVAADDLRSHNVPLPNSKGKQPVTFAICSRLVLRTQVSNSNSGEPQRRQAVVYQQHIVCPVIRLEVECCGLPGNQRCCREEDFVEPRQRRLTEGLLTAGALVLLAFLCFVGPIVCCLHCRCPRLRRGGVGGGGRRSGTLPSTSPSVIFRSGDAEAETGHVDLLTGRRHMRSELTRDVATPHADYGATAKANPTVTTASSATTVEDETLPPPSPPPPPPPPQPPNLLPSNLLPPPYPGL